MTSLQATPAPPVAAVIACGALAYEIHEIITRRRWRAELHALAPLLHNHPEDIPAAVERLALPLRAGGRTVIVAYGDCGTYGALDGVCDRLQLRRLKGLHCYDVLAGPSKMRSLFDEEPGTFVLTDFLVRTFRRTVLRGLGLDRHPELRDDYFGSYSRVVWLTQRRTGSLEFRARRAAETLGLPLVVIETGVGRLEQELAELLDEHSAPAGTARFSYSLESPGRP